jgi:dienelactone hydrolase
LVRHRFLVVVLVGAFGAVGCAVRARPVIADRPVALNGHALRLHFANAATGTMPLLIFASGDGGMRRKDLDAYRHLVALGYPIVGFDAHDYVTHLGNAAVTTPARLAADYQRIIDVAREVLHAGIAHRVVFVGISRGAGLSVVAACPPMFRSSPAGVVAVALTREEEYVRCDGQSRSVRSTREPAMVDVYEYLARLGDTPVAVIQSTRDNYLPAVAAKALFGPESAHRRFQAIDARNHSFKGARPQLYDAMRDALVWVAER